MGRLAEVNSNVVLAVTLWDANTTKGVRARVFNSAGTEVSGSPFTITHRTAGHYTGTGWNPTVEGQYSVSYEVYTDGTFATPDRRYEWGAEEVEVRSIDQDLATLLSRLTAGRATNLDNLDATISSRLTTTTFNTVVGTPVTSVSADIASVKSDTNTLNATKITTARANNLDNLDATVSSRATQTSVTAIDTKLGTPVGASVSVDIASVKSDTSGLRTDYTTTKAGYLDVAISTRASAAALATVQADTDDIQAKIGTPVSTVSADIAAVKSDTGSVKSTVDTNLDTTISSRASATALAAVQSDTDDIQAKIGTPAGVSLSADVASVKSDTSGLRTDYTTVRAGSLDNLDTTISSRASATALASVQADTDALQTDTATLLSRLSSSRATNLDNLDATVSSRASAVALASVQSDTNDIQAKIGIPTTTTVSADIAAVQAAVDTINTETDPTSIAAAVWNAARASYTAAGSFGQANQGVVSATRAANLDNLDVQVSTRAGSTALSNVQSDVTAIKTQTDAIVFESGRVAAAVTTAQETAIADKVWDVTLASHTAVGSTGDAQSKIATILGVVNGLQYSDNDHTLVVPATVRIPTVGIYTYRVYFLTKSMGIPADPAVGPEARHELSDGTVIHDWVVMTQESTGVFYHEHTVTAGQPNTELTIKIRHKDNVADPYTYSVGMIHETRDIANLDAIYVETLAIHSETTAIKTKTDQLAFTSGNVHSRAIVVTDKSGYTLVPSEKTSIIDGVWDVNIAGHLSAGSTGKALNDASTAGSGSLTPTTISAIVNGVWDAPIAAHTLPGTTGQKLEEAGTILPAELEDIATAVWDSNLPDYNDPGSMGYNVNRITNVEANMALAGDTAKQADLLTVKSTQATLNAAFTAFRAVYTDVRGAKLDNLDTSVSSRASQTSMNSGFADTAKDATVAKATQVSAVQTSVNGVQTSVNTVQSDVTSIKGTVQTTGVAVSTAAQDSIVNKVWDEPTADHVIPGTMGYDQSVAASGVITPGDITNIKNAVWDELLSAHSIPGSASEILKTILPVKVDTTDLLGRLNPTRAANLDRLDATISSRESEASASARAAIDQANHAEIIADIGAVDGVVNTINTKLGTTVTPSIGTKLDNLAGTLSTVKAKTDNLPADPASESGVVTAVQPAVTAANQANATSLAVKAKTDNLPVDPAKESSVLARPTNPLLTNDGRLANLDAPVSSRVKPSDLAPLATAVQLTAVQSVLESDIAGVSLQVAQTAKPSDIAAATAGMALEATLQSVKDSVLDVQDAQITPNDVWTHAPRSLTTPVDTTVDLSGLATTAQLSTATAVLSADLATWTPKLTVAIQPTLDEVTMIAWLTKEGQLITDADSAYVTVLDADDNVAFIVGPDLFVSSNGLFKFTRANASTVLQRNSTYACKVVITKGGTDYTDIVPITVF